MFDRAALAFLYTETPLHAGSGTSLGIVDLPIQRERSTGYPLIQASGLKGCLREVAERIHRDRDRSRVEVVFGPEPESGRASDHAGALSVGDARLLLFPVRSLAGVWAWVTSRNVLARLKRDAELAGVRADWEPLGPEDAENPNDKEKAFVADGSAVVVDGQAVLEEFAFEAVTNPEVRAIAEWLKESALPRGEEYRHWRDALPRHLVVLPNTAFRDFVLYSTEVIARIRIDDETKTVRSGGLWTEEHLPSETLLYATLFASRPRVANPPSDLQSAEGVLEFVKSCVDGRRLQLGGDATVGRGFVSVRVLEGRSSESGVGARGGGGES